ncbi:DUF6079 family protein [Lentimicrobium sp. S6]|uniref:DUF6079 family protein n=1 Tax=Lentimicrobium sp. S6 TaxID=2735872 RepID=UPI001551A0F0|nr:DUF6079 family protein [Lentimicrobium sp. S6]NPD45114.1 hypothetical protein [Lentimicrobium sp. S6]
MKYKDLINFEPITEVVKFSKTDETAYQESLIKSFVFSQTFKDYLVPVITKNLDFTHKKETFGLQIVGNYGTGKSHLMSVVSLIAENEKLLDLVSDEQPKLDLSKIAGQFKVLRFELGNTESLWEVISFQLEEYLHTIDVAFSFEGHGPKTYLQKIQLMMAAFEEQYPDKGFLVVIDEMLAYLKGRSQADKLNQDLQVLQALGQACDGSRFKFMFGVQEMIYHSPEFQFASEMLQKVNDRYVDIKITKEDVAYIVKNRLLKKSEHQKQSIKKHLEPFLKFFTDMHGRTEEYIELFPVHPSYFENFEKIRIGKSQREILKTLSNQFGDILDKNLPTNNPGLLTYDKYWADIQKSQALMANADIRKVKEITGVIYDQIDTYFAGPRKNKIEIAKRITNACAIKTLQDALNKQNGTNTENLVDDLCLTDDMASDRGFLIDIMESTAKNMITATAGQYFVQNEDNGIYHLRIEGGVNYDQKIKDYAETSMTDDHKDKYFFIFLQNNLPLLDKTYRPGFQIWAHDIEWETHKTYRAGYIFFGNPNQKSTTQPRQHFYMYFMPVFDESKKNRNHEEDEIYFIMDGLSREFKDAVSLYGAALALEAHADSSQKAAYLQKINELNKKARDIFNKEYIQTTMVDYMGEELPLSGYPLPGEGYTKEQIFSSVAAKVFEKWFAQENKDYPSFQQLKQALSNDNFRTRIDSAIKKIITPEQSNSDGEGILSGLGLWVPGKLDFSHSIYARHLLKLKKERGENQVINRDEIIYLLENSQDIWLSRSFNIEAELEFLVIATLCALGEFELVFLSGLTINSTNLSSLRDLDEHDYYSFSHIKPPKGVNLAAIKAMSIGLIGKDISNYLKDPSIYPGIVEAANLWAKKAVTIESKIQGGYSERGIELISDEQARKYRIKLSAFSGFCDKVANYTTEARIKNFQYSIEEVEHALEGKPIIEKIEKQLVELANFNDLISYLQQAKQYIIDDKLKTTIANQINKLSEVFEKQDHKESQKYRIELVALKEKYAEYYLELYLKYRISEADDIKKVALLQSNEKQICDILKDADFVSSGKYLQLLHKVSKLKVADSQVNKDSILLTPYHEFNPNDYFDIEELSIKEISKELKDTLENWEEILKETLDDPIVNKNMGLLDEQNRKLLKVYKEGSGNLNPENALQIRNAIMELHQGLEKVEISDDDLRMYLNKPMTPEEAQQAFKKFIDELSIGKDRSKIRIILK